MLQQILLPRQMYTSSHMSVRTSVHISIPVGVIGKKTVSTLVAHSSLKCRHRTGLPFPSFQGNEILIEASFSSNLDMRRYDCIHNNKNNFNYTWGVCVCVHIKVSEWVADRRFSQLLIKLTINEMEQLRLKLQHQQQTTSTAAIHRTFQHFLQKR